MLVLDSRLSPLGFDFGWFLLELLESGIIEQTSDPVEAAAATRRARHDDAPMTLTIATANVTTIRPDRPVEDG